VNTYFSTFISGFSDVVQKTLPTLLPNVTIVSLLDGLVLFETTAPVERVKHIGYFNNSFLLITRLTKTEGMEPYHIVKKLSADLDLSEIAPLLPEKKHGTFRVVVSKENELTHVDKSLIRTTQEKIMHETYLTVDPLKADYEFWFLIRSEAEAFFGVRITGLSTRGGKQAEKGELRSELAYFLAILSSPKADDIILDPFAGHGAIPSQRAYLQEYKHIIAGDADPLLISKLRQRLRHLPETEVLQMDALRMKPIADHSITTIITDPPWGIFDKTVSDYNAFYTNMLREFKRVLSQNGVVVVLTAQKEILLQAGAVVGFAIQEKYDILVSGKKAAVYKLTASQE
jgi:23S rRNA G2445 N2-methylase RlmL